MPTRSARPNSWTVVDADDAIRLTYAPQVSPSPLSVSQQGSVQVVITNASRADVEVQSIMFVIPVGSGQDALTAGVIQTMVSNSAWSVSQPAELNTARATFILGPSANTDTVTLAAGAAIVIRFYGFPTHDEPGTATIAITEATQKPTSQTARASFTVTTFPSGFTFSDLTANVPDGIHMNPVAQVEHGFPVTLTWQSSVTELTAYEIYYSTSEGQSGPCTPAFAGEWTSPKLTADTVFTLVVRPKGLGLVASMSTAVAVKNPDLRPGSLVVGPNTLSVNDRGVGLTSQHVAVTAGAHTLVVDGTTGVTATGGLSVTGGAGVTGDLKVTGGVSVTTGMRVTGGIQMDAANAVIQRGDAKLTATDLGLYSSNPTNWIRLVTNHSPIKLFTDGGSGTVPAVTIEPDGTLQAQGTYGILLNSTADPSAGLRFSAGNYTGFSNFDNHSEIANDITTSYGKALMLNGNSSRKPGGKRWVQAWDNLEVMNDLYVHGSAQFKPYGETGWCTLAYYSIHRNGTYWEGTAGPSDLRLKEQVQPVPGALDKVGRLSGVTFRWNETAVDHFTRDIPSSLSAGPAATAQENQQVWQAERDKRRAELAATQLGVIAQEVEAVLPEAVTTDDAGFKSVHYEKLIPLLIEAVKEQAQLVARLQRDLQRLELTVANRTSSAGDPHTGTPGTRQACATTPRRGR